MNQGSTFYFVKRFYKSIQLEYEHESSYSEYFDIHGFSRNIPRIFRIASFLKKAQFILNKIWFLLVPIFVVIYIIGLFTQYLANLLRSIRTSSVNIQLETVYLNTSNIRYFLNTDFSKKIEDFTILNIGKYETYKSKNSISISNLISISNINAALKQSLLTLMYLYNKDRYKMIFYIYPAFNWYLIFFSLNKKTKNIWLSNHYDRWLGLASTLDDISVTITQHGKLYFKANEKTIFPKFSVNITNIDRIYLLDEESRYYFKKYISSEFKSSLNEFKSEVTKWPEGFEQEIKILIVGSQSGIEFHRKLIDHLISKYQDIGICYKYHPRQSAKIKRDTIWEVDSKNIIPFADIVITYGSTLDMEIAHLYECDFIEYSETSDESLEVIKKSIAQYYII